MKVYGLIPVAAAAIFMSACSNDNVKISGRFAGHSDKMIYLEQVLPGNQTLVDSTKLDKKGNFRLGIEIAEGQPTLFNLRYSEDIIPLLLSAGEHVKINSICGVSHNYTVEGSEESARIRELKMLLTDGGLKIDSLYRQIVSTTGDQQLKAYAEYINETNRVKREHLAYIISKPGLLSSLYALYQRLPNEPYLFNEENDILYYRMVADSIEKYYPESPYVVSLRKEVDAADNSAALLRLISAKMEMGGDGHPEINLPDMYGNDQSLSSLWGHVVLVDFWVSTHGEGRLNNGELRKLYDQTNSKGFEIYQVSLDTEKALWVSAVQNQKLPWITVCDFKGQASPVVNLYNIKSIPTNFLIDRTGQIVGRDLYGDKLVAEVNKLL